MSADQVGLAVAELDVAVLELHLAAPRRLDLGAGELQAGLEGVEDLVVVVRPLVGGQGDGPGSGLPVIAREHSAQVLD